MAILNYTPSLSYNNNEVKNYIGLTSTDPNYLKLVFTQLSKFFLPSSNDNIVFSLTFISTMGNLCPL